MGDLRIHGSAVHAPARLRVAMLCVACWLFAVPAFAAAAGRSSEPRSPADSMAAMHLEEGFEIELVASEPLIRSPVAIDWGPDGRLWVVEMEDYPYGIDGKGKSGGKIVVLDSSHHDGKYDKATVFLDNLPMPSGVAVWRDGILVTAAPDILFARDTKGAGAADERKVLFTGFKPGNPQLRVNGLRFGKDGWVYCGNGWSGGEPQSVATGQKLNLQGKDIRIRPDEGWMDLQSGQTEFGREENDWGDWFGCDNSHPLFHFVLDDRYTRRNPNVAYPDPKAQVIVPANPKVFPVSLPPQRYFTDKFGYFTSACSAIIYRDELLFPDAGPQHMFVCEPAYNILHHEIVSESGVTFAATRPANEHDREFLASEDQWFRPVMARTGPDGAVWVVDMYRYMIDHPDFFPPEGKVAMAPFFRDGEDRGRIYRIYPKGKHPGPMPRLDRLDATGLVAAMDSANAWQRDMAERLLLWNDDRAAVGPLSALARSAGRPQVRVQALYTLDGLKSAGEELLQTAMRDPHPAVRRSAVKIAEPLGKRSLPVRSAAIKLVNDPDPKVRFQLACSLGEWDDAQSGRALAKLAMASSTDPYLSAAVMSSAVPHFREISDALAGSGLPEGPLYESALSMAVATRDRSAAARLLQPVLASRGARFSAGQFDTFGRYLKEVAAQGHAATTAAAEPNDELSTELRKSDAIFDAARRAALDGRGDVELRVAAVGLLGRDEARASQDAAALSSLLELHVPAELQIAAISVLGRTGGADVPDLLTRNWAAHSPPVRAAAIEVLLKRGQWADKLLDKVEAQVVPRTDFDTAHRQRLLHFGTDAVRQHAQKALGDETDPRRQQVIDGYQDALKLAGVPSRGATLFVQNCAVCHRKNGVGADIGPDLGSVSAWQPLPLLVAILDPNRQVEPRYFAYTITLNDGDTLYGVITSETGESLTFKGLDGKTRSFVRSQINSIVGTGHSLMPDGLESALDKQSIADVISFLRTTNIVPK